MDENIEIDITVKVDSIGESIKKLKDQLKEINGIAKDVSKSVEGIDDSAEEAIVGVKSLKEQFKEAKLEVERLAGAGDLVDKVALSEAITKMAGLKDSMNDLNEQVNVLAAGSKFEKFGNQLGDVGGKILALDFEGAKESAERLVQVGKTINFKEAISSVKDLGKTFFSMGQALLTNPLLLLAAVIVGIGVVIYKLKDGLKPLTAAFDLMGKAIDYVIQLFKDFGDLLGISDFKGEDAANNQIERNENIIKSEQAKSDETISAMNRELSVLTAKGEDTTEIEKSIQREKMQSAYAQIEATRQIIASEIKLAEISGKMTDERKQKIKDLKKDIVELKNNYKDAATAIEVINIKEQKDVEKNNSDKLKKQSDYNAKAKKQKEDYDKNRLSNERLIIDIENSLIKDQFERELAINKEKYKRLEEDILKDTTKTLEEKKKLIELYNKEEQKEIDKIKADKLKKEEEDKSKEKQELENFSNWKLSLEQNEYKVSSANLDNQLLKDKETAKLAFEAKLMDKEEYDNTLLELEQSTINKRKQLVDLAAITELDDLKNAYDAKLLTDKEYLTKKEELEKDAADKARDIANKEKMAKVELAGEAIGAISGLVATFNVKNEKDAKKQFQITKAFSLGQAAINTGLAVTAALTAGGNPLKLATGAQFVEAGIAATIGAANIIKIASTKYGGSGGSGGGGASGFTGATSTFQPSSSGTTSPQFNLFGTSNNGNENENKEKNENIANNKDMNINVNISESEITTVQNRINKIKINSEL